MEIRVRESRKHDDLKEGDVLLVVSTFDGNRKPWRVRVWFGYAYVGKTGACTTRTRALSAGMALLEKHLGEQK